jgi:hypothetical protein
MLESCAVRGWGKRLRFIEELKRRNVIRVAGLYGVAGWLLAQAASLMESALGLPNWFDAVVICLLLIGFPLAVVFAWVYEITPEGLKRTVAVSQDASITADTARKLDLVLIGAVAVLIVVIVANRFIAPQGAAATDSVSSDDNSIAVLPFTDMSSGHDQEYLTASPRSPQCPQTSGLRVAAEPRRLHSRARARTSDKSARS